MFKENMQKNVTQMILKNAANLTAAKGKYGYFPLDFLLAIYGQFFADQPALSIIILFKKTQNEGVPEIIMPHQLFIIHTLIHKWRASQLYFR